MFGNYNFALLLATIGLTMTSALPQGGRHTPPTTVKCHKGPKTLLAHEAIRVKIISDGPNFKPLDICVLDRSGQAQPTSYTLSAHERDFTFRKGQPYAFYSESSEGAKCKGQPVIPAVSFEESGHVSISQIRRVC